MEILRVEHLSKIYGKGENEVRALDDVSFSVEKGQFVAIIGPSGSGKSTLLHILGGVDRPTSGKVFLEGQDVFAQNEDQLAIFRRPLVVASSWSSASFSRRAWISIASSRFLLPFTGRPVVLEGVCLFPFSSV